MGGSKCDGREPLSKGGDIGSTNVSKNRLQQEYFLSNSLLYILNNFYQSSLQTFFLTKRFSIFIACKHFFSLNYLNLNYLNLTLTSDCNLPIFTANETITNSRDMNYPRMNLIYLKRVYTFQSNQITFENPKFSLPLKRFIVHFLTTLNTRKPKVR